MKNGLAFFKIHSRMATALGQSTVGPMLFSLSKASIYVAQRVNFLHPGTMTREVPETNQEGLDTDIFNGDKLKDFPL